jgi:crotonobetainyl-CoA:carnitine CoA-transferase CaiB-like acyl-CoA transferase
MEGRSPLEGLRVVDLSPDPTGAHVSQVLSDFGAEVVWVEPPGGSRLRRQSSFPFLARGKASVLADLSSPSGLELVRGLAEGADVLLESFRPGVADRLGVGYEPLRSRNPGLVYCSITGFGRIGPWAGIKGYEGVVAALLGLFDSFEGMNRCEHPPFVSVPWCSFAASQCALHGILSALFERARSGQGQWVEANMAQAVTVHEGASSSWYSYLIARRWPDAFVQTPPVLGPGQGIPMSHFVFRLLVGQTKDGQWLQFAQNRPRLFEAFLHSLGLGWMLTDPRWKGIPVLEDDDLRLELWETLLTAVRERSLPEWEEVFAADHDVYGEPYRSGAEVLDHPQLVHENLVVEIDDHERGPVRQPGPMFRMRGTPAVLKGSAPTLGSGPQPAWSSVPAGSTGGPPAGGMPLAGITVLELALQYAAPMGVTLLSDLGARVIKIEPLEGEAIRRQVPQFPEAGGGKVMQGKESVALDLKTPEAIEIVHRLAVRVDAVVEGFRDGAARRIRVDENTMRAINPDLVYVSARGYGVGGPCGDRAAFAPTFGAAAGIAAAQLGAIIPEDPLISIREVSEHSAVLRSASASRYASADGIAALGVASALLIALLARQRGAGGQHVVSSMLQSTAHAMASHVIDFPGSPGGTGPGRDLRGPSALYRIYDVSDGWIFLAAPQAGEWALLTEALAPYASLGVDARFSTEARREKNDAELAAVLSAVFERRSKHEWQADLTARDVACVAVTTGPPEALLMSDEVGRASGYITDITHPVFDDHPRLSPLVRFSRSTTQARPGGLCGDSTDAVLGELGYTAEQITDLRVRKVVA